MLSWRKIDSAGSNVAKSGPKAPEGRRKSSLNTLKDGVTVNGLVLIVKKPEQFQALRTMYLREFQPASQVELDRATARPRIGRVCRTETAAPDRELSRQPSALSLRGLRFRHDAERNILDDRSLAHPRT